MTVDAANTRPGGNDASSSSPPPATGPGANGPARRESQRIAPRSPRAALEPERMPEPIRPSKRARHPFVVAGNAIFTIVLFLGISAGAAVVVGKQRFEAPGPLAQDKVVNIPRGGVRDIAEVLAREGVIDQPWWVFMGGVIALSARDELKYGEYQFKQHASLRDVINTLTEGKVIQHQVTIPEGLTSQQIVTRLLENDILTGNPKEMPKEGTMLPETYRFTRGTARDQLIQRMQQAQRRALQEIWDRRAPDLPIKTPDQLVVLASIVEKETGRGDERARVAAVFVNRLKQKMRLQSDPTIIYGLVGGQGTLGRPIMRSEIEQPTPYNTYVIDGLPPGPIANPGRAALEAAANPSRTRDLYFVSDGSGGHIFAETYEQHQRNVAKLRLIEQQRDQPRTPPEAPQPAPGPTATVPPANQPAPPATPAANPKGPKGAKKTPNAQKQ